MSPISTQSESEASSLREHLSILFFILSDNNFKRRKGTTDTSLTGISGSHYEWCKQATHPSHIHTKTNTNTAKQSNWNVHYPGELAGYSLTPVHKTFLNALFKSLTLKSTTREASIANKASQQKQNTNALQTKQQNRYKYSRQYIKGCTVCLCKNKKGGGGCIDT